MPENSHSEDPGLAALLAAGREKIAAAGTLEPPTRWLLVDVTGQRLVLVREGQTELVKPVSTALAGMDSRQDSGGTPAGVHLIAEKIGEGEPRGAVFSSRRPTGEVWSPGQPSNESADDDLILTRILTLDGQEEGRNRGPGVDSLARYIYIHGTNDEGRIGTPVSHGCIRMSNDDVLELFDQVEAGDPVVIV
jgi:hypothetical protein